MAVYGYVGGGSFTVALPVANTAAISAGDMLKWDGAGQYVTPCGAGDIPCAVALEDAAVTTTDGDWKVLCEISPTAIFEYPPDAGTATIAMVGKTMDVGGAQSLNIDASTDDCVYVVDVDTLNNTLKCRLKFDDAFAGVA